MKNNKNKKRGVALLIAIVTTSMFLIVSFVVSNIAFKQVALAHAAQESQYAFYNADSGTECAIYWDLKDPDLDNLSSFEVLAPHSITCNGQTLPADSPTVKTTGTPPTVIGGAATSRFSIDFPRGCAVVTVTRAGGVTTIESKGYNTCDLNASRRYERAIKINYAN